MQPETKNIIKMAGYLLQREKKIIEELYENETRVYKTDHKFLVASINVW